LNKVKITICVYLNGGNWENLFGSHGKVSGVKKITRQIIDMIIHVAEWSNSSRFAATSFLLQQKKEAKNAAADGKKLKINSTQ